MIGKFGSFKVNTLAPIAYLISLCSCQSILGVSASARPKMASKPAKKQLHFTVQQIAAKVSPSVAKLTIIGQDGQIAATGSGFVVGKNTIATNLHVVWGAHSVNANFPGGRSEIVVGIVGFDASHDIATLSANTDGIPALPLGDTTSVGETVVAVGSPENLTNSVSTGIVSGIRFLDNTKKIQTTAPISPGSSGGPLLDEDGFVIGVTSSHYSEGQNLNFAIPSGYLRKIIPNSLNGMHSWNSLEKQVKEWRTGGTTAPSSTPDAQASKSAADDAKDQGITANALGNTYLAQGRLDEAGEQYRKAILLLPQDCSPHYNLGLVFSAQGKPDKALNEYKAATKLKPDDPDVHDKLASLYGDIGLYDKAVTEADETIRLDPKYADAYFQKGYALAKTNNPQDAELAFRSAVRWNSKYALAYINLGLVLNTLGRLTEARQQWMTVLALGNDEASKKANELLSKYEEKP